jgi:hypothetical protein
VHACRYCGLYEQSIAAHEEARRLDPNVPTSLEQTLLMAGEFDRLHKVARLSGVSVRDDVIGNIGLGFAGRREEAHASILAMREATQVVSFRAWADFLLAWLARRPSDMLVSRATLDRIRIMNDPEAIFQEAWLFCDAGDLERGLLLIRKAVEKNYFVAPTLSKQPQFDALRGDPAFREVLARAEAGREQALAAFREGGGERLLGRPFG